MRILILGGTTEASQLAASVAGRQDIDAILSYAGRTNELKSQPIPIRVGGFGGVEGLSAYLSAERIDLVIDATHPFAMQISANAAAAARGTGVPLFVYTRAPWSREPGDTWTEVADNATALAALGGTPKRVFLTIGRLGIGDFRGGVAHHYLIRAIDPPPPDDLPANHELILARGIFTLDEEIALMRDADIEVLVTKNSGGAATYAKIAAARALAIRVILVTQPVRPDAVVVHTLDACLATIAHHGSTASIGTERRV